MLAKFSREIFRGSVGSVHLLVQAFRVSLATPGRSPRGPLASQIPTQWTWSGSSRHELRAVHVVHIVNIVRVAHWVTLTKVRNTLLVNLTIIVSRRAPSL